MSDIDVKKLTIADLKKELNARGVVFQTSALKAALQTLLADAIAKEKETKANPVPETTSAPVSDAVKPAPAPAVVESNSAPFGSGATPAVAAPVVAAEEPATTSESTETGHAEAGHEGKQLSDAEKKRLRAQKFGIPIKVNDPERVNQRKERFGTFSEDEKKSKRAERFAGNSNKKKVEMTAEDKNAVVRFFFQVHVKALNFFFFSDLSRISFLVGRATKFSRLPCLSGPKYDSCAIDYFF
jgi:hypothetical protein